MELREFRKIILGYYRAHGRRGLPWRKTRDPYKILVSEVMLQQTQVSRVIPKYTSFLKKFPTTKILAKANLADVLSKWQGLGYNRRALYLKKCAEKIETDFNGVFPKDLSLLLSLPGIGPATAGDILAFAWNIPEVVIETNIRTVFLHFFFKNKEKVSDTEIRKLVEKTLDRKNPREWYWALFDYGSHLKETSNPNTKSSHYKKQSPFKGSNREKRSHILKLVLEKPRTSKEIEKMLGYDTESVSKNLEAMLQEGIISQTKTKFFV